MQTLFFTVIMHTLTDKAFESVLEQDETAIINFVLILSNHLKEHTFHTK